MSCKNNGETFFCGIKSPATVYGTCRKLKKVNDVIIHWLSKYALHCGQNLNAICFYFFMFTAWYKTLKHCQKKPCALNYLVINFHSALSTFFYLNLSTITNCILVTWHLFHTNISGYQQTKTNPNCTTSICNSMRHEKFANFYWPYTLMTSQFRNFDYICALSNSPCSIKAIT